MEISVRRWDGQEKDSYIAIAEEILNHGIPFDRIIIDVPHNKVIPDGLYDDEGTFYISIWGYIGDPSWKSYATRAWEKEIPVGDRCYKSSSLGRPIITFPENLDIAEFIAPNKLIIHADICHYGDSSEKAIYSRILEETLLILSETYEPAGIKLKHIHDKRIEKYLTQNIRRQINSTRVEIENADNAAKVHLKNYMIETRKKQNSITKLIGYETMLPQMLKKISEELEALKNLEKIKDFKFNDETGTISIFTKMIYIYEGGEKFKIGEFKVNISIESGSVSFYNLTEGGRRKSYWSSQDHHPHVNGKATSSTGTACLGNIAESVAELITESEFSSLATLLISFLESVNISDAAGKYIYSWDSVNENDEIIMLGGPRSHCYKCNKLIPESALERCDHCGTLICEDCRRKEDSAESSTYYCNTCWSNRFYTCDHCHTSEINRYEKPPVRCIDSYGSGCDKEILCPTCAQRGGGDNWCPDCFEKRFNGYCKKCGTAIRKYSKGNRNGFCKHCIDKYGLETLLEENNTANLDSEPVVCIGVDLSRNEEAISAAVQQTSDAVTRIFGVPQEILRDGDNFVDGDTIAVLPLDQTMNGETPDNEENAIDLREDEAIAINQTITEELPAITEEQTEDEILLEDETEPNNVEEEHETIPAF